MIVVLVRVVRRRHRRDAHPPGSAEYQRVRPVPVDHAGMVSYRLGEGRGEGRSVAVDRVRCHARGKTPALLRLLLLLLLLLRLRLLLRSLLLPLLLRPQLLANEGDVLGGTGIDRRAAVAPGRVVGLDGRATAMIAGRIRGGVRGATAIGERRAADAAAAPVDTVRRAGIGRGSHDDVSNVGAGRELDAARIMMWHPRGNDGGRRRSIAVHDGWVH